MNWFWRRARRIEFIGAANSLFIVKAKHMTQLAFRADQRATLSVRPVDRFGNPATLNAAPTWAASPADALTVSAAADGLSAVVASAAGKTGVFQVVVTGSAGTRSVTGTIDVVVSAAEAASLAIDVGAIEAV